MTLTRFDISSSQFTSLGEMATDEFSLEDVKDHEDKDQVR